jgi:CubicO group peptidase (beta-lactamase class C family)
MKSTLKLFAVNIGLAICVNTTYCQLVEKLDDSTMEAIEDVIESYVWGQDITGMAVAFIQDGKVAYTHGEGSATTYPDNTPFLTSTKSLLASVSKPITAVLAMRLVQEGHLELDETIDSYISGYANTSITIRHLLDHQSGISHYSDCPGGYNGTWDAEESIEVVQDCNMCITPPGAATWYTTFGTTLLGAIVEEVGLEEYGQGFISLYNTWIKDPGNLTSLLPAYDNSASGLAQGHDEDGDPETGYWNDIGWKLPAGGFISNIYDLAKFGVGVMEYTFLDSIHSNMMWVTQSNAGGATVHCDGNLDGNFGLGWGVSGSGINLLISHNGVNSDHGYRSRIELYPRQKKGFVILMNQDKDNIISNISSDLRPLLFCPQFRNFTSAINWSGNWNYKADQEIKASCVINNTAANLYFGADVIKLTPGFHALKGVDLNATIFGCNN